MVITGETRACWAFELRGSGVGWGVAPEKQDAAGGIDTSVEKGMEVMEVSGFRLAAPAKWKRGIGRGRALECGSLLGKISEN